MRSFFDELASISGLPFEIINSGYKVVNFCGKSVFIEGFKSIISVDNEMVVLKLKKGRIKVVGEGLTIKDINLGQIFINGNIVCVEVV